MTVNNYNIYIRMHHKEKLNIIQQQRSLWLDQLLLFKY